MVDRKYLYLLFLSTFITVFYFMKIDDKLVISFKFKKKNRIRNLLNIFVLVVFVEVGPIELQGIFSTYALSLLADREFSLYIDRPCNIKKLLEPNEIDWNARGYTNIKNLTTKNFHLIDAHAFIKQLERIDVANFEKETNLLTN